MSDLKITAASKGVVRYLSTLMQRASLAARAGIQFGGARDLYATFGWKRTPTLEDYLVRYVRQDIASRIIDAPVNATWREPPLVTGKPRFNKAWETLVKDELVWNKLERLDRLTGLGEFGVLLIGLDDGKSTELPVVGTGHEIIYLQPYMQISVEITSFDEDPISERYSKPLMYKLKTVNPTASISNRTSTKTKDFNAHYSRVLHVNDALLDDDVFGIPRLSKVYNILDDLLKVSGGTAETYWLIGNRGMQIDLDKEMALTPEEEAGLDEEVKEFVHGLSRVMRTRGVTAKPLGSETPSPKEVFDMIISLISGATGIPKRILTGSEAGQLASLHDRANWAERIFERQISFAGPLLLRPFIMKMQDIGILPQGDFEIEWPEAFRMSPLERAQEMAQKGRAAANLSKQLDNQPLVTQEEGREILGLPAEGGPEPLPRPTVVQPGNEPTPEGEDEDEDEDEEVEGEGGDEGAARNETE